MNPLRLSTEFQGFSTQFSPFDPSKIVCSTSQYFGVAGNGKLCVSNLTPTSITSLRTFYTQHGIYDSCWSECNPNQIVSACGDGTVKIWDLTTRDNFPVLNAKEHMKDTSSVHFNQVAKNTFASAAWDGTVKIWGLTGSRSIQTFAEHQNAVYGVAWSPHHANVLASVAGDRMLKVWDTKQPRAVQSVTAHGHEILCLDWCKYQPNQIVTGSADKLIKIWDLRQTSMAISVLAGHDLAVRSVKCSPHEQFTLASVSYDMSVRLWNFRPTSSGMVRRYDHHSEFVCGLDWSLFLPGQLASCAWDRSLTIWNTRGKAPLPLPSRAPKIV